MPSTYAYLIVMSLPELPPLLKRTRYGGENLYAGICEMFDSIPWCFLCWF
jgi:hypothetical protein